MLNTNAVSIDELRSNLADIVNRVTYAKDKVVVKKYNRDAAIIISLDEYERLIDPTRRLSDIEWKDRVRKLDKIRADVPRFDPQAMEEAIDETVAEVRVKKKTSRK